jgi:hypothetical protein
LTIIASHSPSSILFRIALPSERSRVMDVMTAKSAEQRRHTMTIFTIDQENAISAFATAEEAATASTTPFDTFSTEHELADLAKAWPTERLVAILNSLPGEKPVKKLKEPKVAIGRIWARIQGLGGLAKPEPAAKPKADKKAKGRARSAKGAPTNGKATKKATPAKNAPKTKKVAKESKPSKEPKAARAGSKSEEVIAMLKRKNGATLAEIVAHTGWQKHTTRGWISGFLGKKLGIAVESFKPEGGERTYRIK